MEGHLTLGRKDPLAHLRSPAGPFIFPDATFDPSQTLHRVLLRTSHAGPTLSPATEDAFSVEDNPFSLILAFPPQRPSALSLPSESDAMHSFRGYLPEGNPFRSFLQYFGLIPIFPFFFVLPHSLLPMIFIFLAFAQQLPVALL